MSRITQRPVSESICQQLEQAGIHPVLARILAARGILGKEAVENTFSHLIPPHLMLNLDKAANLLADAIIDRKKMTVIADYDCDGATACAVAVQGIRMLGGNIDYIVPNRFDNGYGLTPAISELTFREHQTDILITVDNGIASIEGVARANELGMQVLVTDHHLPGEHIPRDCIIVNPNQKGCPFPSKNLAGVGVIFYILLGIRAEMRRRNRFSQATQPHLDTLLDLVALGTVSDIVPLDHNNRILVSQGLQRIRNGITRPGITALFRIAGRNQQKASSDDLGFAIGPRLNAAGRLSDMTIGVECLLSQDMETAMRFARELDTFNLDRQRLESSMKQDALAKTANLNPADHYTICISSENWHQGVIGLLAARIREHYYRPTIVFTEDDHGNLQGSGRSIPHLHIRDVLAQIAERFPGIILKFGGHAMAAGLTIPKNTFHQFCETFEQLSRKQLSPEQLEPVTETDGSLATRYLTEDFVALLGSQTWGMGFPSPLFYDEFTVKRQRVLKNAHLKLLLERDGRLYEAIQFQNSTLLPDTVKLAYRPVLNTFNNRTTIQLTIETVE